MNNTRQAPSALICPKKHLISNPQYFALKALKFRTKSVYNTTLANNKSRLPTVHISLIKKLSDQRKKRVYEKCAWAHTAHLQMNKLIGCNLELKS